MAEPSNSPRITAATVSANTARLDERLQSLVIEAIDALPEGKRTVRGKVRTGEEIARAIPDQAAFLAEIDLMQEGTFFELNEAGQLVMRDGCEEAYGLGENSLQAKIRQTRIVYRGENGQVCVMTGEDFFTVTKKDEKGTPLEMEMSQAAKAINPNSILMKKGLPTLQWDGANYKHVGEYARMNDEGQFDRQKLTWTEDESLDSSLVARGADWDISLGRVGSFVNDSGSPLTVLGSRGVLRVNLNLEA